MNQDKDILMNCDKMLTNLRLTVAENDLPSCRSRWMQSFFLNPSWWVGFLIKFLLPGCGLQNGCLNHMGSQHKDLQLGYKKHPPFIWSFVKILTHIYKICISMYIFQCKIITHSYISQLSHINNLWQTYMDLKGLFHLC